MRSLDLSTWIVMHNLYAFVLLCCYNFYIYDLNADPEQFSLSTAKKTKMADQSDGKVLIIVQYDVYY